MRKKGPTLSQILAGQPRHRLCCNCGYPLHKEDFTYIHKQCLADNLAEYSHACELERRKFDVKTQEASQTFTLKRLLRP